MKTITMLSLPGCLLAFPMLALAGPVDVNTADAATISAELQGVGMVKAQAIVEFREANGPFESADELTEVKGIASRTVEMNRGNILLRPSPESSAD